MTSRPRPSTPAGFKASVEQRLKDRAGQLGQSVGRTRNLWVMERWLARVVSTSTCFVLKGGLSLELRLARARTTRDIDLWMKGTAMELEAALAAARAFHPNPPDFLQFACDLDPDAPTITGAVYEGQRFRARATLAGKPYGDPFGLDVAFADPLTGRVEELAFAPFLELFGIAAVRVPVYPLATLIAEKLHAYTLQHPDGRTNSRAKDLVDLALLATDIATASAVSHEEISSACQLTFDARGTHAVPREFPPFPDDWRSRYASMKDNDDLPWPTMDDVWDAVVTWMTPILALAHPGVDGRQG